MSLINDALQRAKAVQQKTPPPTGEHLPLRPVDPQVVVTHGVGLALPIAFAAVALLLLFFVWRFYMDRTSRGASDLTAAARTNVAQQEIAPAAPETAPGTAPAVPAAAPQAPQSQPPIVVATASVATPPKTEPAAPAKPAADAAPTSTNAVATSETPAAAVTPPAPPPLKLQGVSYSRTRPSAIISGKTLFLGDRIRDLRVVAIGAESVTLTGAGRTNVLVLSD